MKVILSILFLTVAGAAFYYLPASHHHAGMGTYFLRQYVSFHSAGGVIGWGPGQEIHELLKAPYVEGSRTVTDGKISAVVPETVLTQDVEDAEAMRLADSSRQSQARDNIDAIKMHIASRDLAAQVDSAKDITRINAMQVAASTVGTFSSRLNEPTRYVGGWYTGSYYYGSSPTYYPVTTTSVASAARTSPLQQYRGTSGTYSRTGPAPQATPLPSTIGTAR